MTAQLALPCSATSARSNGRRSHPNSPASCWPIQAWSERHRGETSWIDELLDDLAPLIYRQDEL